MRRSRIERRQRRRAYFFLELPPRAPPPDLPPDFFALPDFFAPLQVAPLDFVLPFLAPPFFAPPDDLVAEFAVRVMALLADLLARAVALPSRAAALPARSVALPACRAMLLTALDVEVVPLRPVDERAPDLPPDLRLPPGRTMSPSVGLTLPTVSAKVSSKELPRLDPRSATSLATSVA